MTEPVELVELRGWLRGVKGTLTFDSIARWADPCKPPPVSACTLRRALDGRLPTRHAVLAFARGAVHARARKTGGASEGEIQVAEQTAQVLREAAERAVRGVSAEGRRSVEWVPGWITTRAGLARAMQRLRAEAGQRSLSALVASPEAAGRLSRSALQLALTGGRLPSERLLTGFAAACGASKEAVGALLDARERLAPKTPLPSWSGACADASYQYQAALARVERGREIYAKIHGEVEEEDWFERERREADELYEQKRIEAEEEWHERQLCEAGLGTDLPVAVTPITASAGCRGGGQADGWQDAQRRQAAKRRPPGPTERPDGPHCPF